MLRAHCLEALQLLDISTYGYTQWCGQNTESTSSCIRWTKHRDKVWDWKITIIHINSATKNDMKAWHTMVYSDLISIAYSYEGRLFLKKCCPWVFRLHWMYRKPKSWKLTFFLLIITSPNVFVYAIRNKYQVEWRRNMPFITIDQIILLIPPELLWIFLHSLKCVTERKTLVI